MSAVSSREKNMLLITVVLVLYAVAALSYKKQAANWKAARRTYAAAKRKVTEERALIAARDMWSERYETMRGLMPIFPYEKDVDTHWLNLMDSAATRNGFSISRRQANKEVEVGDVYELPIECKDWEAPLESLVRFLHDLHQQGAMLDVRQLFIRPSTRPGFLKGSFTLYCAYMRGDAESLPRPPVPAGAETNALSSAAGADESAAPDPDGSDAPATGSEAGEPNPSQTNSVPQGM